MVTPKSAKNLRTLPLAGSSCSQSLVSGDTPTVGVDQLGDGGLREVPMAATVPSELLLTDVPDAPMNAR